MKVDILSEGAVIGQSILDCVDPSMGVATGRFEPTIYYLSQKHARIIDGQERECPQLIVRSHDFGDINCEGVGIEDFSSTLAEIEVTVLGIGYPDYETYFANHPSYRAFKI
ncbi:hypothetical protein [Asticcacaulis taihuensis]|uniref:hypothetical protein n=1 Tax=Asticcacaulis taihuensis TaxID=260084 RepID=UPI0026EC5C71|nr:hypothetical protein [Asticcacaulis taihuensis]